jgi:hypothetical protein
VWDGDENSPILPLATSLVLSPPCGMATWEEEFLYLK